jgi:hypothetical protein
MTRQSIGMTAATMSLAIAIACHPPAPIVWMAEPGVSRVVHQPGDKWFSLSIETTPLVAVGDTVSLAVNRMSCHVDVCIGSTVGPPFSDWIFVINPAEALEKVAEEKFIARQIGAVRIDASRADTVITQRLNIVPPVASLAWDPAILRVRGGDTLHACAVARDARGRVVGIVRPNYAGIGGGLADIGSIASEKEPCRWVAGRDSGQVVLAASLGPRVARLPVTIVRR